jgi:hypothetical protein
MPAKLTPEQQKQQLKNWVVQWRSAEVALYEQKFLELQAMTEEEALRASNMLLWFAQNSYRNPQRQTHSGLVEQQRIFHGKKANKKYRQTARVKH